MVLCLHRWPKTFSQLDFDLQRERETRQIVGQVANRLLLGICVVSGVLSCWGLFTEISGSGTYPRDIGIMLWLSLRVNHRGRREHPPSILPPGLISFSLDEETRHRTEFRSVWSWSQTSELPSCLCRVPSVLPGACS